VDNFWSFFWLLVWSFFFVAYLMILFNIFADLFRDRQTGGWAKAFWVIFLLIAPFLAALIYLIARGHGMAERQLEAAQAQKAATDRYIQTVAGSGQTAADQIASAKSLLDSGAITQAEFDALKAKALS
jgi:hypothetical protein